MKTKQSGGVPDSANRVSHLQDALLLSLAFLSACGGVLRMCIAAGCGETDKLDYNVVIFFAAAGALVVLRQVKKLAFGDFVVEMNAVRDLAQEASEKADAAASIVTLGVGDKGQVKKYNLSGFARTSDTAQAPAPEEMGQVESTTSAASVSGIGKPSTGAPEDANRGTERKLTRTINRQSKDWGDEIKKGSYHDDPWLGQFGGSSADNCRLLTAKVTRLKSSSDWFTIRLEIRSTDPENNPLLGQVRFFLHDSFDNDKPWVPVGADGKATLSVVAYGAFTVGALCDGGKTKLELNLAELPDAPREFRER
jgi:hypothetical protein